MYMKYICLLLVVLAIVERSVAQEAAQEDSHEAREERSFGNGLPLYCYRTRPNGQPVDIFKERYQFMLDEFNLNRASGQVWQNPTRTYAILAGTDVLTPISDVQYFWSDVVYNQQECRFEYIQVWPALDTQLNRIVYRVQQIAADLDPPTFANDGHQTEGPATFKPVWISPPIFEHAGILTAQGYQVINGPRSADTTFIKAPSKEISNEQRSVLTPNQKRYYSLVIQLDDLPPGFATTELKMFWYSTVVQAPRDVRTAITKFINRQLPLLPDPANPGYPGFPNIYIYVPPAQAREENDSPVTVDNFSYRPNNATAAAELYKDFLRRHA